MSHVLYFLKLTHNIYRNIVIFNSACTKKRAEIRERKLTGSFVILIDTQLGTADKKPVRVSFNC
jgi:hypothetical protein